MQTNGSTHIVDITGKVQDILSQTGFVEGAATIFVIGSTGGITTLEFEPGLVNTDLPRLFEILAPYGDHYAHHDTWGCDNGSSHLKASLLGSSLVAPFTEGALILGTWQQIVFIDFDTRPRSRRLAVQLSGVKGVSEEP